MPQIINTNIASLNAQRNLNKSQSANQTALQRLSSGLRINSAKDDAAGLAISTRFNSQIRGLNVAVRNAGDGISLAQTAEGALGSMNDNLQRIRELAVQSANATNSDVDRDALQAEVSQLLSEVSRTATETDFNGRKLLDGSFTATFQIGANAGQTLNVSIAELTSDKLGAAASAGLSATGNANALANGDLTINGVAIEASKAGDDTASTNNAAASAIAKVAAINAKYDETGVKAQVNENVVSGAEMAGAATSGTMTLNGVDIELTTTTSTSQTRAGVVEAINAVSDQTGVMAINSDTDTGGVQLVAADGRNIEITFSTAGGDNLTKASTGIGGSLASGTGTTGTFEGGYTLVADSDVATIEIQGGNGTGNGDLANAGLTAGTYDRGKAISVSEVTESTVSETKLSGGTATANILADINDSATLIAGGAVSSSYQESAAATVSADTMFIITSEADSASVLVSAAAASEIASAASLVDAISGVAAFERITFSLSDFTNASNAAGTIEIASAEVTLNSTVTGPGSLESAADRLMYLTDQINGTTFKGGSAVVTAELNAARTEVFITIDNYLDSSIQVAETGSADVTGVGFTVTDTALFAHGNIAFETSDGASPVTVAVDSSGGTLIATDTFVATDYGETALSSTGSNQVTVAVDGTTLSNSITVAVGSTVSDLAEQIDTAYKSDGINAWEDIELTFDATNLAVGDTIFIGAAGNATAGVGLGVAETNGTAGITVEDLAETINTTDFSAQNIDISATLNAAKDEITLNIRNFSGAELGIVVDGEGRSLTQKTTNNLVGAVEQQLSGVLAYSSAEGQEVAINISNPDVANEFFSGNSSATSFAGVDGLEDGDVIINGVSIGAAQVNADKASAEFASDNTNILSSSKTLSGIAIAASINQVSDETGVSATVNATKVVGGDKDNVGANADLTEFAIGDTAEIFINGYSAGAVTLQDDGSGGIDTDRARADALTVINSVAGKTGVQAIDNGVSLTMTAEDGRNISIAIDDQSGSNASIGAVFGMDAANVDGIGESTFGDSPAASNNGVSAESATYETTYSTVTLESAGEFTIEAGSKGADELVGLGLAEGKYGGAVQGQFLRDIDISTFEGATAALTSIDNAIQAIASQRADLGAIQNRMESTVSNLAITSENLAAANSRIQDADFAAETAELSRTQVLQQAGISILAQANQGPQQVLSLLG